MKLYRVKDWDTLYENNRTRELKSMAWVPVPNSHDGDGYTALVCRPDGPELFGAWNAILQVASRCGDPAGSCGERGTLLRNTGIPHDPASIARMTRFPEAVIAKALEVLSSDEIQWLTCEEMPIKAPIPHEGATKPHEGAVIPHPSAKKGREGKEGNGTEGKGGADASPPGVWVQDVAGAWDKAADNVKLPKIAVVSDKRRRHLEARLREPFFVQHWQPALAKLCESNFCKGTNERGWVATFDWFISPDAVAKIMEGKYDDRSKTNGGNPAPSSRPLTGAEQRSVGIPAVPALDLSKL